MVFNIKRSLSVDDLLANNGETIDVRLLRTFGRRIVKSQQFRRRPQFICTFTIRPRPTAYKLEEEEEDSRKRAQSKYNSLPMMEDVAIIPRCLHMQHVLADDPDLNPI